MHAASPLRDPLFVFLMTGVVVYALYATADRQPDEKIIHVGEADLLEYVQFRSRRFDRSFADEYLDGLSAAERQQLIEAYVREEALVREARALSLDNNDYVIRRRLVQKLEFIARGFEAVEPTPSTADLERFYAARRGEYFVEHAVSFAHVYYSAERHGDSRALALAQSKLGELNSKVVPFHQASAHGDSFFYHVSYIDRTMKEIDSHFGGEFVQQLALLKPAKDSWQGPFESRHGHHLVLLTGATEGRVPPLEEVRDLVVGDYLRDVIKRRADSALDKVVTSYEVKMDESLR